MTYVATEACIRCKYMDCVEVCPVDCFYVGENMLVIRPDECIDCGLCEPECPAEAILSDTDQGAEPWLQLNRDYSAKWPNITQKGEPPPDAEEYQGVANKFEQYFSPNPGGLPRSVGLADVTKPPPKVTDHRPGIAVRRACGPRVEGR